MGARLGTYEVAGLLGAGGMGEVYRAHDPRLGRDVAIKVIADKATPDLLRRFEQEARAAGALNHPNVLVVFDVGSHEGRPFVVSELLEGETLQERMRHGGLTVRKAVNFAIEVAEGLAAAHEKRIVHRDLKPANVFVSRDGHIKILDFGLAKLTQPEDAQTSDVNSSTETGAVLGTAAYMSPEQVRSLPVDHRSDIFSLGTVLYEMLSGRRAFHRGTPAETMAAVLNEDPPELTREKPDITPALARVVTRCLEKKPEERFQAARDVAFALEAISGLTRSRLAVPGGPLPRVLVALALVVTLGTSAVVLSRHRRAPIDSIAILPFVNTGGDPDADLLSDGITESLINKVSQLPNVKVIAWVSVFRYKGKEADAQKVARELNVRAVMTGRVVSRAGTLSISAELVEPGENRHLWGDRYERRKADIFAIQDEIAREISERLRLELSGEEKRRLAKRYTNSPEAYELYLKGRSIWSQRTPEAMPKALDYYRQALEKDPDYALAVAGSADVYALMGIFYYNFGAPRDVFPKAEEAVRRALDLDPDLAEAHSASARCRLYYDWDWPGAEREFKRSLELNPNDASTHHLYSHYFLVLSRFDESLAESRKALELDPVSPVINAHLGEHYRQARQYDLAIQQFRNSLDLAPTAVALGETGHTLLHQKRYPEAVAELETARTLFPHDRIMKSLLATAYASAGRRKEAVTFLDELKELSRREYVGGENLAEIYMALGDKNEAFRWLETAFVQRSSMLTCLKIEPWLDSLRSDPRFAELQKRVGLPP